MMLHASTDSGAAAGAQLSACGATAAGVTGAGVTGAGVTGAGMSAACVGTPLRGRITVGGRDITALAAHQRNVGVVFQNYALFPHLTVAENIAFGLRARGISKAEAGPRVAEALALVRMEVHGDKPVTALSGGQQQRVAVARALVVRPSLLLLDEPFSALDRKLRETMQVELKQLLREVGITAIFVTHDQEEALVVSDRVAVMNAGQIEQLTDPVTLYHAPASLYVLDFVGQSTKLSGKVLSGSDGMIEVQTAFGALRAPASFMAGSSVAVGVRPEAMFLAPQADPALNTLQGRISDISFLGSRTQIHLDAPAEGEDRVILELSRLPAGVATGQEVSFGFRVADTMAFPA